MMQPPAFPVTSFSIIVVCFAAIVMNPIAAIAFADDAPNKIEIERFLKFSEHGNVELQKTRGLLDLNGSFTIEMWVRWSDKYLKKQYICGDHIAPGLLAELPVDKHCGFVLEATAVEDADERCLQFSLGATVKGKSDWFRVQTSPMKGTDGLWQHIAVSKTAEVIRIYWNGDLATEKNCKGVHFNGSPSDLYLGLRKGAKDGNGFVGDIRAFRA